MRAANVRHPPVVKAASCVQLFTQHSLLSVAPIPNPPASRELPRPFVNGDKEKRPIRKFLRGFELRNKFMGAWGPRTYSRGGVIGLLLPGPICFLVFEPYRFTAGLRSKQLSLVPHESIVPTRCSTAQDQNIPAQLKALKIAHAVLHRELNDVHRIDFKTLPTPLELLDSIRFYCERSH